jgi:hypothetical protein
VAALLDRQPTGTALSAAAIEGQAITFGDRPRARPAAGTLRPGCRAGGCRAGMLRRGPWRPELRPGTAVSPSAGTRDPDAAAGTRGRDAEGPAVVGSDRWASPARVGIPRLVWGDGAPCPVRSGPCRSLRRGDQKSLPSRPTEAGGCASVRLVAQRSATSRPTGLRRVRAGGLAPGDRSTVADAGGDGGVAQRGEACPLGRQARVGGPAPGLRHGASERGLAPDSGGSCEPGGTHEFGGGVAGGLTSGLAGGATGGRAGFR